MILTVLFWSPRSLKMFSEGLAEEAIFFSQHCLIKAYQQVLHPKSSFLDKVSDQRKRVKDNEWVREEKALLSDLCNHSLQLEEIEAVGLT